MSLWDVRLPDAHVTATIFLDATVDMLEVLLHTRAKDAARDNIAQWALLTAILGLNCL